MIDKYNYPNDSPNECCKNFLKNMDFVPSGTFLNVLLVQIELICLNVINLLRGEMNGMEYEKMQ